jgi:hypothetical protein
MLIIKTQKSFIKWGVVHFALQGPHGSLGPWLLLEAKTILNGGMSTNGVGTSSKFYLFYLIFASFKLNI